jgi:pimeloyl-ACP methyl ester carboxylesterase
MPPAASDTAWLTSHPLERLDVGTAAIAYRTVGSGPPLLLIHGWPFSSLSFRSIARLLAERFTCILPDTPGLGETTWHDGTPFAFARQVTTIRAFVDRLDPGPYRVLAHDTGATLARLLALDDPRATELVLLDTEIPGHRPPWIPLFQALAALPGAATSFRLLLRSSTFRRSSMAYGPCFADPARLDDDFHACFVAPLLASTRRVEGVLRYVRGIDWTLVDGLAERHRQLRARVRFVWGADDTVFPIDLARAMLPQLEGRADLVAIPSARFLAHEERPAAVAEAALAFYTAAR